MEGLELSHTWEMAAGLQDMPGPEPGFEIALWDAPAHFVRTPLLSEG